MLGVLQLGPAASAQPSVTTVRAGDHNTDGDSGWGGRRIDDGILAQAGPAGTDLAA
jgi:hypothetical protein